jgi:hypothetical protein
MAVEAVEATESLPKEAGLVGLDGPLDELDLTKMLVENFENNGPEETSPSGDAVEEAEPVEESTEEALRTLPAVRQAVDRADCLNGQRVWKTNIAMQELTVANKARLAKCWHCHPGVP